jgi:dTDP-4-amino-4,6-dideoxygalactose transaminase
VTIEDIAPIQVSGSDVGDAELAAVARVFDVGYLGMGAEVAAFESELTEFFGRPAVCVSTGTAALQLAVQACGIGPGDEVIVPSFTYVASFQAISATGATPVAAEIDPVTLTVDPDDVRARITARTRAIMPVHYASGLADMEAISALADEHGLRVIEDAAHAFGTTSAHGLVGSYGDIACFSFDPIKNVTAGEGGCVVTDDEKVLERVRDARLLGVIGDSRARVKQTRLYQYDVEEQGWRYHMSNIMASIGRTQLARFPKFAEKRRLLATRYQDQLANLPGVELIPLDYSHVVPHVFVIRLDTRETRDRVRQVLADEYRIGTAIHYHPNHVLTLYRVEGLGLPITDREAARVLTIPLHTRMNDTDVDRVVGAIRTVLET